MLAYMAAASRAPKAAPTIRAGATLLAPAISVVAPRGGPGGEGGTKRKRDPDEPDPAPTGAIAGKMSMPRHGYSALWLW